MINPEVLFIKGPVRLTKTQVKTVDYILGHPDKAAFLSAAELGRRLGVSDATVVRLAQSLGFSGFSAMQNHLREHLRSRLDTVSRMERTAGHIATVEDVLPAVMRADIDNLERTVETTSLRTFAKVVEVLHRAEEVHIVGLRSAHSLAQFLASALKYLGRRVHQITPGIGEIWAELNHLDSDTVLVAFSFPRYTRLTIEIAEAAKQAGGTVIAFTDSALSPLATRADYVLPASFQMDSFMESFVAALSLLNAVVTAIAFVDGKKSIGRLKRLEQLWAEKSIYYRDEAEEGAGRAKKH